mmetsp:Transcript_22217/g.63163  ORF Transcript_22217/g.63163 Transcript_22217/m.63163 type:complete len:331 (-) Transcript_22217:49-1041(-)
MVLLAARSLLVRTPACPIQQSLSAGCVFAREKRAKLSIARAVFASTSVPRPVRNPGVHIAPQLARFIALNDDNQVPPGGAADARQAARQEHGKQLRSGQKDEDDRDRLEVAPHPVDHVAFIAIKAATALLLARENVRQILAHALINVALVQPGDKRLSKTANIPGAPDRVLCRLGRSDPFFVNVGDELEQRRDEHSFHDDKDKQDEDVRAQRAREFLDGANAPEERQRADADARQQEPERHVALHEIEVLRAVELVEQENGSHDEQAADSGHRGVNQPQQIACRQHDAVPCPTHGGRGPGGPGAPAALERRPLVSALASRSQLVASTLAP